MSPLSLVLTAPARLRAAERAIALLSICLGAPSPAVAQNAGLTVTLNESSFAIGQTMVVSAHLRGASTPISVDAYVVLQIPTGQFLSLQLGGGLVAGIRPIAAGFTPFVYDAVLTQYTFTGREPTGTYTWYSILTRAGTLEFVTPLEQVTFTFDTSSPATTRVALSAALRANDSAAASGFLGYAMQDKLVGVSAPSRQVVASALDTCSITEFTAVYQVCKTADGAFGFVMVRDDTGKWRVVVW